MNAQPGLVHRKGVRSVRPCAFVPIAAVLAALLAGCQHAPRSNTIEPVAQAHRQPGYVAEQRYVTSAIREAWILGGESVEVILLRPSGDGVFPLVIYLPGLGEPSSGGAAWRNAWAQAGYAVLSLQSAANGEAAWSSAQARRGEFPDLARDQFSRSGLARRLAILRDLLDELNGRQARGALAGVDLSRIALAGFDLGAQTVMAAAGETGYNLEPFVLPVAVKCVIALSPYADFAGAGFDRRFASIVAPVLSVTSPDDADPYGLVAVAAIRRAPFEHMPPGQKYLLNLVYAPHALISGKETPGTDNDLPARDDRPRTASADGTNQGSGSGRRQSGGGSQKGHRGGSDGYGESRSSSSRPFAAGTWVMELALVQSVTTAYLDTNLKNDGTAKEWLARDARRWLGDEADFLVK